MLQKLLKTTDSYSFLLIRLTVGLIFLSEGIQKFLYPGKVGSGRFEKIGFDNPAFWASFTACFEIACGLLIIIGFVARIATVPLLCIMIVAFVATKYPVLINEGFWTMAHAYRTDFAMTMLLIFILIHGAGKYSVDNRITRS